VTDGKRKGAAPEETVTDLAPVPDKPGDTLDAPTDAAARVPNSIPLLDAVPDGPGWTLDESSGEHRRPSAMRRPSKLDVVASEPARKAVRRRAPVGSDAFESGALSEPSLEPVQTTAVTPASDSSKSLWIGLALLLLLAAVLLWAAFFA
jgi:hypothetical protein